MSAVVGQVVVEARDSGIPPHSANTTISVTVIDSEIVPRFENKEFDVEIDVHMRIEEPLLTLTASYSTPANSQASCPLAAKYSTPVDAQTSSLPYLPVYSRSNHSH